MAYEKRVCVLKQIKKGFSADGGALTGAVYAERLGSELTVIPKIAAAPLSEGRYCIAVWADGQIYCLEYQNAVKLGNAPSLARGFAALLCFVKGEAEPIAYGGCGEAPRDYSSLLGAINRMSGEENATEKKRKRPIPQPVPPVQIPGVSPNAPLAPTVPLPGPLPDESEEAEEARTAYPFRNKYDDEAIATSDYFCISESDENDGASARNKKEKKTPGNGASEDESGAAHIPTRGSLTYYREVKDKLDEVFEKYPRDERLKAIFPMSEWVNSEGALLGVIYEEGVPRYLCVAVEALKEPPAEVKERGVFVPKTQFSDEEGFYVVFQDADTGEYVRVYDA